MGCTPSNLRQAAEELKYEVKLLSSRQYRDYKIDDRLRPFRSQERMEIIMKMMQEKVFDVDAYLEAGVILWAFPYTILLSVMCCKSCGCLSWVAGQKGRLLSLFPLRDMKNEGPQLSFEHLSSLKMYVGERLHLLAWFSHYIICLIAAAVPGMVVLFVRLAVSQDPRGIQQGECLKTP